MVNLSLDKKIDTKSTDPFKYVKIFEFKKSVLKYSLPFPIPFFLQVLFMFGSLFCFHNLRY